MRYTPVLEFKVDPSIDEGLRITQILSDIEEAEAQEDV
jgi:ribosome-binding factor A